MRLDSKSDRRTPGAWLLRRSDQAAVAVLVVAGLGAMGGWWIAHGGLQGRLVDVDGAGPRPVVFQVDANTAGWPELAQLPGVGEVLARRIVRSRDEEGPFVDQEDLQRVTGIGPKKLEAIRPYLLPMQPRERKM